MPIDIQVWDPAYREPFMGFFFLFSGSSFAHFLLCILTFDAKFANLFNFLDRVASLMQEF